MAKRIDETKELGKGKRGNLVPCKTRKQEEW